MDKYTVKTPEKINVNKRVVTEVPGSKSITNRALLLAALSKGTSRLVGCQFSDDAKHFLNCLKDLGFELSFSEETGEVVITGGGLGNFDGRSINVGSAGTAARFLVAMLGFSAGTVTVNSSDQMKKRPMQPLIESLRNCGAEIICLEEEGHFPLQVTGVGDVNRIPGTVSVNIDKSSQFLSALLIAGAACGRELNIEVTGSHGLIYADMTVSMIKDFGVNITKSDKDGKISYVIPKSDGLKALNYFVEPDMSAAAYFYGAAALTGSTVTVKGVKTESLQGDVQLFDVLLRMGCRIDEDNPEGVTVTGPEAGRLTGGFEIDMGSFSDQALTVAVLSAYADAPVVIVGIGHIRLQESDRIEAIKENLARLGVKTEDTDSTIKIIPDISNIHGGDIITYEDHRVAMSFSLAGLRTEGVTILDPSCVSKTFKDYFEVFDRFLIDLEA